MTGQVSVDEITRAIDALCNAQGDDIRLQIVMTRCTRTAVDLQRLVSATTPGGTTVGANIPVLMGVTRKRAVEWLNAATQAISLYTTTV